MFLTLSHIRWRKRFDPIFRLTQHSGCPVYEGKTGSILPFIAGSTMCSQRCRFIPFLAFTIIFQQEPNESSRSGFAMESTKTSLIRPSIHVSRRRRVLLLMMCFDPLLLLLTMNICRDNFSGGAMGWRIAAVVVGRHNPIVLAFSPSCYHHLNSSLPSHSETVATTFMFRSFIPPRNSQLASHLSPAGMGFDSCGLNPVG